MIIYLSLEEVKAIHRCILSRYGGLDGVHDEGLLESAISQPRQSAFSRDLYPDVEAKAAALFYSIVKNHGFIDGNKRTAVAAMLLFLLRNDKSLGGKVKLKPKDLAKLARDVESGHCD